MTPAVRSQKEEGRRETPDGRPLRLHPYAMCTCAVHCSNRCEPACCGDMSPWCDCWHHADEYAERAAAKVQS